jgi:ribosome-associated protein
LRSWKNNNKNILLEIFSTSNVESLSAAGRRPFQGGDCLTITKEMLEQVAEWLREKKGRDIVVLNLAELSVVTDYFLIVTGGSPVQTRALTQQLEDKMPADGWRLNHVEGKDSGRWILMDYGDLIIHIMLQEERDFYALERLWGDADTVLSDR